jgi:tetratricopeptide (TPR) repeat protein
MPIALQQLPRKLAVAAVAFVAVFLVLRLIDGSAHRPPPVASAFEAPAAIAPGASTDQQIAALQEQVGAAPDDPLGYGDLGNTYLQKVRETGDATFYTKADGVFHQALRLDPSDFTSTSGLGSLALSRHDFRGGLAWGERARRINPTIARNYGVIADAQIELGRYAAAGRTLQRWVDLQPELSSYARVSYFRELHGDLPGAISAMRLAVSAGGDTPENSGYVQTLVGTLRLDLGAYAGAERAYRSALALDHGYPPALAGLARVEAGRGDYAAAIRHYRHVVRVLPLPEYVIGLGETEQAAGRRIASRRDYALVGAETQLLRANGVNTDVDLALFEANHGNAAHAVVLGRRAWAAAPSVRSADAYAWALSADGRQAAALHYSRLAMRLGSRDPSFLFHAGVIAHRGGDDARARSLLGLVVSQSPRFNPLYGPEAGRILREAG